MQRDMSGAWAPVVIFKKGRKKKKSTAMFKPVEQMTRSIAEAADSATSTYLARHKQSNRKRKDGWIRDIPMNVLRASNKAAKEIRPAQFLGL
jgi:hypothetical protein